MTLNIPLKRLVVILLFLIANKANAQPPWHPFIFFNNVGGLNDGFASTDIADNEASRLENGVFTLGGSIQKRAGYTKLNSSVVSGAPTCTGITFYKKADGTKYLVSVWSDDKIRKMDYQVNGGPDGTWDDITGSLSFSVGANNLASFTVAENTLIIEDGISTTAPYKWTGSGNAAALGGSPPNGSWVEYHKNHLFIGGNNTNTSRISYSNLDAIETWTATDFIDLDTNDGTIVRAGKKGLDAIYFWKDKSIWRLSGTNTDDFILERFVDGVGTLSHQSIGRLKNSFIFVSDQGDIILYDGAIKYDIISNKIQGTIDTLNFNRFIYSSAIVFDDDYFLSVSDVGTNTNNKVIYLDSFHLAWSKFTGMNINAMCVADDGNGKDTLVFGDYSGFTYKYPSGNNDAGVAIEFIYESKIFRFEQLLKVGGGIEKIWRRLDVFVEQEGNYNLIVETRTNYQGTGTQHQINLQGASSLYRTARYGIDTYADSNLISSRITPNTGKDFFQVRFYNGGSNEPVTIRGYYIWMEPYDRI